MLTINILLMTLLPLAILAILMALLIKAPSNQRKSAIIFMLIFGAIYLAFMYSFGREHSSVFYPIIMLATISFAIISRKMQENNKNKNQKINN